MGDETGELGGIAVGLFRDARENLVGQQADIFGEEAENDAVEEMGDFGGVEAALAHGFGHVCEVLSGLLGDGDASFAGPQFFGVEEDGSENFEAARVAEAFERDFVRDGYGLGEIGVDDDAVQVADDEDGRTGEGVSVEEELIVGVVQILVLALVFPAEEILFPDIGKAVAAAVLFRALFKAEGFPRWIGLGGRGVAEHAAQVEEMLLRGGAFL